MIIIKKNVDKKIKKLSKIYGGEINQHTSIKFSQAEDEEINLIANDLELTETKFSSTCQNKGFEPSDSHFTGQKTIKEDIISNLNCFIDKSVLANIVNQLNCTRNKQIQIKTTISLSIL